MRFYLGAHHPRWLERVSVPLFVSHAALARRPLPRAAVPWACDSGAFGELAARGEFSTTAREYARWVRRYRDEVGCLEWAAPQDHMCEPFVLARSTIATTVAEAQTWTVANYLELRTIAADLPIIPVLQGFTLADYLHHAETYLAAGIILSDEPLVGLGSVCRRQATAEIAELVGRLSLDYRLHGFGVKTSGLTRYGWCLASADSLAWSYDGRRIRPCPHRGRTSCANCPDHALAWRARALTATDRAIQLPLIE